MNNILEVNNLSVKFRNEKIIDNLSFNLKEKDNLVILGPNGAGKSVLLKTLLGLLPFEGEIKWKKEVRISYVPQKFFPSGEIPLSVEEFFKLKKIEKNEIEKSLRSVGLTDLEIMKKKIGVISTGEFQRAMIAWSLADNPDVLLFDEPTAGIDIGGEETIYNLLMQIEKELNLTMVIVTHELNIIYKFANSVLCLNKKAVCYGTPEEALTPESIGQLYGGKIKFYQHQHD
ncbi:MAG: metal ABC transporter ATP-binding protein [Patescibacteria group bacterium]